MSFGRTRNVVRRAVRPDGSHHRARRRGALDHPLAVGGPRGVLRSLAAVVNALMERVLRR